MITDIIEVLRKDEYYGGGDAIEFAKGSNEYITSFSGFKNKVVRKWQSQRK